ncbi:MAG TPA: HAD hydrolase family protein [Bacteroidales bacterium]|jgi:3-deoxy-D-manno-octulosonate 8-phosphate phosphatase (KDO 8-P phosphatase)|nr:HAD hydrolase family protein [Bacteroidales bacterium]
MPEIKKKLQEIKAFVFDVDGVFTNGSVMLHPGGEFIRMMNIKDGFAVQHAVKMGYPIAVITGGYSKMVRKRFEALGVKDIYMKCSSKMDAFHTFLSKYDLKSETILCMGDDLPDYEIMKLAGFPCCPSDAASEIIELSLYVSDRRGGEGCVRDIIEQVLRLQGKWMNDSSFVW